MKNPLAPSAVRRSSRSLATLLFLTAAACQVPGPSPEPAGVRARASAATLSGFTDTVVFSGLTNPIAVRFASNGKVFVAEENGRIWFLDSLTDATPTLFADLRSKVNSYWDRGMLGFTLHPNYPTTPYIYVLYDHDTATNAENNQSVANRNGTDDCPSPPGGTSQGCVTYGRLSRITDDAHYPETNETVLVTEWAQQFPSHSIGTLMFGADGMLYASAGDGASFSTRDYGQFGLPVNPLGDPPGGVGGSMTAPTARGGSLRSQSLRRPTGEDVRLNGTVIRIDPMTGAAAAGNPLATHADLDARRIVAYGLRNPYRFTIHPTTGDIWIGDVGENTWEEVNRIPAPATSTPVENFGWPCYEGAARHPGWDTLNLNLCETLYSAGTTAHNAPYWTYHHDQAAFTGDTCNPGANGSAVAGVAFYQSGNYPSGYANAMFVADYARDCIWVVKAGTNGLPNNATIATFISGASNPNDLEMGPGGDLYYTDYDGGTVHRVRYQAPTAIATANPTSGFAPLAVSFDGSTSTVGVAGDTLSYAWDLDGNGVFDDATIAKPSHTYSVTGTVNVRLKVTDQRGGTSTSAPITITVGTTSTPPVPVIDTPAAGLTWVVGDSIAFSGHATDAEDGNLPATGLYWEVIMEHCPAAGCHEHTVQTFDGVTSGAFPAPDHEYPSYLVLRLTATDSAGARASVSQRLDPRTVDLTFQASPGTTPGLQIGFNAEAPATPFTRTVIVGSNNTVTAPTQSVGTLGYTFLSWSDGGAQSHNVVAPDTATTYTATFQPSPWSSQDIGAVSAVGSWSESSGTYTVTGSGADIWNTADEFRYVYRPVTGDATITARVTSLENTNAFSKAGVMFRDSLSAGSMNVHALASPLPASLLRYIVRATNGASATSETGAQSNLPAWVRVVRAGNVFTGYSSFDGTTWTQLGTPKTIAMAQTLYVGLAVTSHADGTLCTATFDNVTLVTPAPPSPPPAPAGLGAVAGNGQVSLSWSAASGAVSYALKRATTTGGPYTVVQPNLTGTSFTDGALTNGTTYFYVVSASNAAGESPDSAEASATPALPPPPAAPTGVAATPGNAKVTVTWSAVAGATSYTVKSATTPGGPYSPAGTGLTATSFTHGGLTNGTRYYYVVSASNAGGEGADSTEASATPALPPPAAPTGVTGSPGNAQATISWSAVSTATSYTVKRATITGGPYTAVGPGLTATTFTNTGLTNGTVYYYVVSATNASGEGPNSTQVAVTPAAPITWTSADIGTTGATGSSAQSGATFTIKGAGADIYNTADAFRFTYQNVSGNATIIGRVASIQNVNAWSKAGVMMRAGTGAGAANVFMLTSPTPANGYRLQVRSASAGTTTTTKGGAGTTPTWFKIVRSGNNFSGFYSANGTSWTALGPATPVTMPTTIQIGLAVSSHVSGTLATGTFDSVTITTP
jgi:glucose/arabinose dehydrogenase/regulation of enolase protein 1 (concanavalin A-like superfamily)